MTCLLDSTWTLHQNNQILELLDPSIAEFAETEAIRMIRVALLCTQALPMMRPLMSRVVSMLIGDMEVETATSKPSYLTDCDLRDITSSVPNTEGTSSVSKDSSQFFFLLEYKTIVSPTLNCLSSWEKCGKLTFPTLC